MSNTDTHATAKVQLKPFLVPNFAVALNKQSIENGSFPLKDLDYETLDRLCNDFRMSVFKKAGYTSISEKVNEGVVG